MRLTLPYSLFNIMNHLHPPWAHIWLPLPGAQLLQASPHQGLQVQNYAGEWINVPPLDNTFVVNIGKGTASLLSLPSPTLAYPA
jgi:hypothetical protein